jgi:hypothetical protein
MQHFFSFFWLLGLEEGFHPAYRGKGHFLKNINGTMWLEVGEFIPDYRESEQYIK